MSVELKIPAVGESITEVEIGEWHKAEGDEVAKDEILVELETDKATVELPAPVAGILAKILRHQGEAVGVGDVIARIDEAPEGQGGGGGKMAKRAGEDREKSEAGEKTGKKAESKVEKKAGTEAGRQAEKEAEREAEKKAAPPQGERPKVRREEEEPEEPSPPPTSQPSPKEREKPEPRHIRVPGPRGREAGARREEEVPMSPMRRRIAQRLVDAQRTGALLTTFNEIDMSAVQAIRQEYRPSFEQKHGVRLGLVSFFVKAAIDALKLVPQINAEIRGRVIVFKDYYDIGVAVAGGKGLVVPVLRDADRMSFAEIELAIKDFAERAKTNKITLEELEGGTFTITNGGVYGSLLSTPIVNPPQSGILGMHVIQDRPVAREGQAVIRPMMYVALTYDHRIVDGREAVMFLKHVKEVVETPARMLIEA